MGESASEIAANLAEGFEGFSSYPYLDPVGIPTIGFGSTRDEHNNPVTMQHPPITRAQGLLLLQRDMSAAFADIAAQVRVPITGNEKAALADFIYNLGDGNFEASTLLRLLNAKNYEGAAQQFDRWDRAGGQVLAGLLRRRQAETALFNKP